MPAAAAAVEESGSEGWLEEGMAASAGGSPGVGEVEVWADICEAVTASVSGGWTRGNQAWTRVVEFCEATMRRCC